MKYGKKYAESVKSYDRLKTYDSQEAIRLAIATAKAKFDETIELHVRLGIDPRQADQQVRGVIVLPNGTGKTKKVLVIAKGERADAAQNGTRKNRFGILRRSFVLFRIFFLRIRSALFQTTVIQTSL